MRPKNRIIPEKTIYFKPELSSCPHCASKLVRAHAAWKKKISTLKGVIFAWSMSYRCSNPHCIHADARYRSAEAEQISMKFTTYGFDVLCLVGELRFRHHMTRQEIAEELNRRGVKTTDRNVQMLYERYLTLLGASVDQHVREILDSVSTQNGGLLLSMDGVQPEKGNETLYVIREVFSGTVLAAKNLKSGSSEELQNLIRPIVELGYPIIGIVSDGQQSIRLAFETLLPDVPYQYCQYHYLKDIAKSVVDLDRKLKTGIKKTLRGIREVERKIEAQQPSEEIEVAKGYIAAVRSVLLEDGNPPLDLPGMRIYQNAKAIQASLEKCLSKKGAFRTPSDHQNIQ
jgi:hypothetical protein